MMTSNKSKRRLLRPRYCFYCLASCFILLSPNPSVSFLLVEIPLKILPSRISQIISLQHRERLNARKSVPTVSKPVESNITISPSLQSSQNSVRDSHSVHEKQSWNPMHSLGSLLSQRQKIDAYRLQANESSAGNDSMSNRTTVNIGRVEIIDETQSKRSPSISTPTIQSIPGMIFNATSILSELSFKPTGDIDKEQAKELDESISMLSIPRDIIMKDIKILDSPAPASSTFVSNRLQPYVDDDIEKFSTDVKYEKKKWWGTLFRRVKTKERSRDDESPTPTGLPLSEPQHTERIEMDMRHLAVTIGSSIDSAAQWKFFCENGGSILPMLQCIMDGASAVPQGVHNDHAASLLSEKQDLVLAAASSACKTLRDLCIISKALSVVLTDEILRYDAAWSKTVWIKRKGDEACRKGGIISAMLTLLHYSFESDARTDPRSLPTNGLAFGMRRKRKEARRRCGLYVLQLLYSMAFASDDAINTFRATSGFNDSVLACSSLAQKEQLRRRWIRYPIEVIKRKLFPKNTDNNFDTRNTRNAFLAAASVAGGLTGQIQAVANQILAAIGYNIWVPKIPGQKGIRILSLDGGGTRGITAISTLRAIVGSMGGIEVCDSFDMIVGTSTGAIIAFLVGLRRESSQMAKRRYDRLIRRIFVKSALSAPMLVFTTATYDESPFNEIMEEILLDNSMLASRADPRVPYVFAVSSKMGSTPTQLCLFRNYNYNGGEKRDPFVMSPEEARSELGLAPFSDISILPNQSLYESRPGVCVTRNNEASRHTGSFRVLQRVALRASTAAPTVFKPVKLGGDLYCDGGIGASNPTAVAIHEARMLFPNIPIEMVVSCGTGAFLEESSAPRIGWDGIISQIIMSATDCEQTHHILEDILGQGGTVKGRSSISQTKYFRFNPVVGSADNFPIDNTDPVKLEELNEITTRYMKEQTQARKLREISAILGGQPWWRKLLSTRQ